MKRSARIKWKKTRTRLEDRVLPSYTQGEEIFNMVSHIVGGGLAIAGAVLSSLGGGGEK